MDRLLASAMCSGTSLRQLQELSLQGYADEYSGFDGDSFPEVFSALGEGSCPQLTRLQYVPHDASVRPLAQVLGAGWCSNLQALDFNYDEPTSQCPTHLDEVWAVLGQGACPRLKVREAIWPFD